MIVKKILVPTDLSVNSRAGAAYALSLAHQYRAELIFFYVASSPAYPFPMGYEEEAILGHVPVHVIMEEARSGAKRDLEHFVYGSFNEGLLGLKWTLRVSLGKVIGEIVSSAREENVDLIAMAKRHRRWPVRFLSPSVSEAVSRLAPCPVLSVCPPQIARSQRGGRIPIGRTLPATPPAIFNPKVTHPSLWANKRGLNCSPKRGGFICG